MDGRPTCYRCFRPETHCVCGLVVPFEAHCRLLILQHPHERRKYYSTARILLQAVRSAQLMRGIVFRESELREAFAQQPTYLLYPRPDSVPCESAQLTRQSLVVVIDGTWSEAGKMFARNPILHTLPTISFRQPLRSTYRIRKQPQEHCLSTIESVAHMLKGNALARGQDTFVPHYEALLAGFNEMIERQIKFFPRSGGVPHHRRRMRTSLAKPLPADVHVAHD